MEEINFNEIKNFEDLKLAKNKVYSQNGILSIHYENIKKAPADQKKELGKKVYELKMFYDEKFKEIEEQINQKIYEEKINNEFIDVTKDQFFAASLHPITLVEERIRDWFIQNGFFESEAGEITTDELNFEKLNIPKDHPARAMQDSLYINKSLLLRTHNTGISAEVLAQNPNQIINNFAIGSVYRNDEDDATHSHQFRQVDIVSVGQVSFGNLIWTLKSLLSYIFEEEIKIRLRPSYFPFTEPSVEVDMFYKNKWMEVLGAGMIHKNVLEAAGFDTNKFNGFAAGLGIERLVMIKYNISDIRELYKNDLRFLYQFKNEK
ncbi:phenylalanine--tRNA ligase subunit alpha [Mycoplasmopsis hyopharyngis]|uniref:phenylalanine--tRNA ligase subunit alpha n=1 Tax=Mycoplasmopsis hyopharyngis TaxID=29558 RepID=UPI0038734B0F